MRALRTIRRALVTGGAGFIGSHTVDALVAAGVEVIALDSLEAQVHDQPPSWLNPAASYFWGRVGDPRHRWGELLDGVDTVFYLAAKVGPNQSMREIADYVDCNIGDCGRFLQALSDHGDGVERLVLSASMGPFGEGRYRCDSCGTDFAPDGSSGRTAPSYEFSCPACGGAAHNLALDEATPLRDISFYGLSKNVQEKLLTLYAEDRGLELVSLRYFSVYGPRQALGNPYGGPIPIWIRAALAGEPLRVFEDGNQTRDFISVHDIAQINRRAAEIDVASGTRTVINCGTGAATRIEDVARQIQRTLAPKLPVEITGELRAGDLRHSLADNSRLRQLLGYETFVPFADGLAELLRPYAEQVASSAP